jgi:membrane-associated phospholipid phosphatase
MTATGEPLFGIPRGDALRGNLILSCAFGAYFWIVYWTGNYVAAHSARAHVALPFESAMPFVPWTIVLYLTITPLLCLAPFLFRTPDRMLPLFATMVVEVTIAGVVFCLYPVELSFPPQDVSPAEGFLVWLASMAALQYNCVPSLHVALAATAGWAYLKVGGPRWRFFVCAWVAAIVVSTLLGHQHHLVDLAAGAVLTWIAIVVVPPRILKLQRDRSRRRTGLTPLGAESGKTT